MVHGSLSTLELERARIDGALWRSLEAQTLDLGRGGGVCEVCLDSSHPQEFEYLETSCFREREKPCLEDYSAT